MPSRVRELQDIAQDELTSTLLPAFTACLGPDELCHSLYETIEDQSNTIRRSLLNRLLRLLREKQAPARSVDDLVTLLIAKKRENQRVRVRVNSILTQLYSYLTKEQRLTVLTSWRDEGFKDSMGRWLKAISGDEDNFDSEQVLTYWRQERDFRAAKLLAYQSSPEFLSNIMAELVEHCEEGWIIGKAAVRAADVPYVVLLRIGVKLSATYAYVCAMTGRRLSFHQATALVRNMAISFDDAGRDQRSLAVWAIGHMGLWDALQRIRELIKLGDIPPIT